MYLPAPAIYASSANDECKTPNVAEANRLLDAAGWKRGSDGIRKKNGVRISILYQTSTNSVRQATQAFIKEMWKQIGVETELRNLSASVFFGGDIGSPDTYQKFLHGHRDVHQQLQWDGSANLHVQLDL